MKLAAIAIWGNICVALMLAAIWASDSRYAWSALVLFIGAPVIYSIATSSDDEDEHDEGAGGSIGTEHI